MTEDKTVDDQECVLCGFPSIDGVWYDGTCEDCHDIVIEQSIYKALGELVEEGR